MFDSHEYNSPDNLHSSPARRMSPHERADAMLQEEKESRRRWEAALSPIWPDRARFVALYGEPAALIWTTAGLLRGRMIATSSRLRRGSYRGRFLSSAIGFFK